MKKILIYCLPFFLKFCLSCSSGSLVYIDLYSSTQVISFERNNIRGILFLSYENSFKSIVWLGAHNQVIRVDHSRNFEQVSIGLQFGLVISKPQYDIDTLVLKILQEYERQKILDKPKPL